MMTFKQWLEYDFNRNKPVPALPYVQGDKLSIRNTTLKPSLGPKVKKVVPQPPPKEEEDDGGEGCGK